MGLKKAYNDDDDHFYDSKSESLYIAGTKWDDTQDALTDMTIPLNMLELTDRYKKSEQYVKLYNPKYIIGHSLGSAITMRLAKKYNIPYRAYATPTLSMPWDNEPNHYSHYGDPISMLDMGSQKNIYKGYNPHSYGGYK